MTDAIEHGTYGGYQAHRKAGERGDQICEPCRVANNAYQRGYRGRNPRKVAAGYTTQLARARALRRLARLHPDEFRKLYDAELAR